MRTLLLDPPPAELRELLERRRRWGADTHDEVWEGVLHVVPAPNVRHARISQALAEGLADPARAAGLTPAMAAFNLGSPEDYRVPDGGLLDPDASGTWLSSAALVVEIVSPDDETWEKLSFYGAHDVRELLIVDPGAHQVHWLGLTGDRYEPIEHSTLIDLGPDELARQIDWP
jgi:Uma2 family endonuclease